MKFQKLSLIFNNMSPEKKQLVKTIGGLMGVGILLWLIFIAKPQDNVEKITGCPIFSTSDSSPHGAINLPVGTIFGYPAKSGENLYDIIRDDTFIMSAYFIESFEKDFRCFKTEDEAINAGYKKFLSNQTARKQKREEAKKFLDEQRSGSTTDAAKTLRAIDTVIGI